MTRTVGIDMGGTTSRVVVGDVRKGAFEIQAAREVDTASLVDELAELGVKRARPIVGLTGRDMILRTTQVPPVPPWQLRELLAFEIEDIAEQSGDALAADYAMLGGAALHSDEDMVLLALVRASLVEERSAALGPAGLSSPSFTPNAVALHNAFVASDGRAGVVLVASIGGANTDVALVEDGELLFARNLGGGGDVMTDAVASAMGLDRRRAENVKLSMGTFPAPGRTLDDDTARVARALDESLRSIAGMLQSSIVMCRTQLRDRSIAPDVVLVGGPAARIDGFDRALSGALGMPVERFDPTEGYAVGPDVDGLDDDGGAFAVATGLAMMGALNDSYRVEIVSDATRRAREFRSKTVWLVGAALLVLANLVVAFVVGRADHAAAEQDAARLRREARSRSSAARDHLATVAEAREASAQLAALEAVTAPGAGVVTALDLMSLHLPNELWVTSLRTRREGGGDDPVRTLVAIEGRGKEVDRPLTDAITTLTQTLRADPRVHAATTQASTDPSGDFLWDLRLDLTDLPDADATEVDAELDDDLARAPADGAPRGS